MKSYISGTTAKKIYSVDMENLYLENMRKQSADRRNERLYFMKQKLAGLSLIAIGCVSPLLLDGDLTYMLLCFMLGIPVFFTTNKALG